MISFQRDEKLGDGLEVEEAWEQLRLRWHTLTLDNGEDGLLGTSLLCQIMQNGGFGIMIDADEISVAIAQWFCNKISSAIMKY